MFCRNCGAPVEGEQDLCNECAAKMMASEAPAQEETQETFELNTAEVQPPKKAKKKKGGLIAGIAAAVVAVAAAAVFIFMGVDGVKAFVGRTFQSPEDYLVDVESAAIQEYTADVMQAYGKLLAGNGTMQTAAKAEIGLTVGNEILTMVESAMGSQMDLDWLNKINLTLNTNMQDTAMQVGMGLGLGNSQLLSADVIYDMGNGKAYVAIPELNKNYLYADVASEIPADQLQQIITKSAKLNADLTKALPTEEEMSAMIDTYVNVALSGIKSVEKDTDTVTIDGASQKMVVLTAKIRERDLVDIAEEILKTAEKDKTLKKTIKALEDYVEDVNALSGAPAMDVDLYEEFTSAIPELLEGLEEAREEASTENYVKVKVYVDMKNNVRGHELSVFTDGEQEGETISWLTVVKGNTTYTEAELGEATITGEKTEKKGVSAGSYTLQVEKEKIGTLEFENVTENGGTLRLIPSEDILADALSGSGIPAMLSNKLALEWTYSTEETKITNEINILMDSKKLIGLTLSATAAEGGKISIPTNAVNANSQTEIMQWAKGVDVDGVIQKLESANVPQELVSVVKSYANMLKQNLG